MPVLGGCKRKRGETKTFYFSTPTGILKKVRIIHPLHSQEHLLIFKYYESLINPCFSGFFGYK